jgi:IS4 transposase
MLMSLRSTLRAACGSLSRLARLFRWIKQHLRIKHFFGTSPNAVKTQVWIAVSIYVLIAILLKELKLPRIVAQNSADFEPSPFWNDPSA